MAKVRGTYAAFDVAKEAFLLQVSQWRETNVFSELNAAISGELTRCTSSENTTLRDWRRRASERKLLSICAHGGRRSVRGCSSRRIYVKGALSDSSEVPGAVIHLVVCETMPELGHALVECGADAVIGYDAPFSFFKLLNEPQDTLPSSTVSALRCDAEVLFTLAHGETAEQAIAAALRWAERQSVRLVQRANAVRSQEDLFLKVVRELAVLTNNASHLALAGNAHATITTPD